MKTIPAYCLIFIAELFSGCQTRPEKGNISRARVVYEDSVFNKKFIPYGDEYTGADATYSVMLPNGESVWIFGDTFLGNVTADNKRVKTDPLFIRNSLVTFENGVRKTHHQGDPSEFKSAMIPPSVQEGKETEFQFWYWPGDGFVHDGKLNVFVSKFYQVDPGNMWGFEFRGTDLVELSIPDFKQLSVVSFEKTDSVHYGHAILEDGSFLYIYGLKKQFPYVARAKAMDARSAWEYFNGRDWVASADDAQPILQFAGSEQFSVFKWKDQYVMVMQEGGFGKGIYSFTSATPSGPWNNKTLLYETPIESDCKDCFTYNAMAHPQFMEDDYLLISYNTNTMKLENHYADAMIYRPRFIRVPMEMVLPMK